MNSKIPTNHEDGYDGGAYWREPLDSDKYALPHSTVFLIKDRCKGCGFCIEFCPREILELSDEFNAKGYHPPRVRDHEGCFACRLCELICPEFAIYINEKGS